MKITGTIVNYYIHCRRQCWLFAHYLNFEDDSEEVRIGRILHEIESEGKANSEIQIEGIKVDKITKDYVVEIKKSDADIEAAKWQALYYLYVLKQKGINRKGKLEFLEKKKQTKKIIEVSLDVALENQLTQLLSDIENYLSQPIPDNVINQKKCSHCGYYGYCYI